MKYRLGVAAAIGCALLVALAGCGGSSGASKEEIKEAEHRGAERAQQRYRLRLVQREVRELKREGKKVPAIHVNPAPEGSSSSSSAPESSGSGNCGGGLSANEYTTCGFAENVEGAYYSEIGSGSGTVEAWSPTTEQTYSMYCSAGEPHECTGGNNAAVFFP